MKYAERGEFEAVCRGALEQIEQHDYAEKLRGEGCQKILKYGIACYKKECRVMVDMEKGEAVKNCGFPSSPDILFNSVGILIYPYIGSFISSLPVNTFPEQSRYRVSL